MADTEVLPDIEREEKTGSKSELEPGWLVICWNDPVNLMTYVTHVFQTVFGWETPLRRRSFESLPHPCLLPKEKGNVPPAHEISRD